MTIELLAAPPPEGFDVVIAGDIVLRGAADGRLSEPLAELLRGALTVVNLEAPLVEHQQPVLKAGPHLALPARAAAELRALGVDVAGLANNHVGDHGAAGVRSTLAACREAGLTAVGAGEGLAEALRPATLEVAGARVAVLAGAEREFGIAELDAPGAAPVSALEFAGAVAQARQDHDVVIVLAHGGVEELPLSPPPRVARLHELLAAGADVVAGAHPHTVQGWEEHGGGVAFHSLGDLLFDREAGEEAVPGALVGLTIEDRRVARVALLGVRRSGSVVGLADAAPPAGLADAVGDDGLWQELAVRTFTDRYLPLLRRIGAPVPPPPSGPPGLRTMRDTAARLRLGSAPTRQPESWEALQLLNLLRCESQRWTIETALELAAGAAEDRRTPATRALADALLEASGYRSAP